MRSLRRLTATFGCASYASFATATPAALAPFRPRRHPRAVETDDDRDVPFGFDASASPRDGAEGGSTTGFVGAPFTPRNGAFAGGPGSSLAPKAHLQETPTKDRIPPAHYNPADPRRRLAVLIDGSRVDASTYAAVIEPMIYKYGVPVIVRVFDTDLRDGWLELVEPHLSALGGAVAASAAATSDAPNKNWETRRSLGNVSRAAEPAESERRSQLLSSSSSAAKGAASSSGRPIGTSSKNAATPMATTVLPSIEWFRVDRFIPVNVQIAADTQHLFEFRSGNRVEGVVVVCSEAERAARFEKYFPRLQGRGFSQISFDEKGVATTLIEDGREGDGSIA